MKNFIHYNVLILLLGIGFLSACDMKSSSSENAGAPTVIPKSIQSSELESFVKAEVKGADPERYTVHFSWPLIEDGKIIRIRLESVLAEVLPTQTFFTHQVAHDQRLKYYVDILDQSKNVQDTFSREVIIPRDFVVRENQHTFTAPTELYINRLYLESGIALETLGNNVSIFTNEIHSSGGTIKTFAEGAKSTDTNSVKDSASGKEVNRAYPGRNGGKIIIKSSRMVGELRIELRGENAADGKNGVQNTNRATDGTFGGNGTTRCFDNNGYEVCDCHRPGTNGGNGADGAKGENGWYGGHGGSTGSAQVFIQAYTPSVSTDPSYPNEKRTPVIIVKTPGLPGKRGVGAAGQPGGRRGEVPASEYLCPGEPGLPGNQGPNGDNGEDGSLGKTEESCIYVGSENINECIE